MRTVKTLLVMMLSATALSGVRCAFAEDSDAAKRAQAQAAEAAEAEQELKTAAENQKMRYENYIGTLTLWPQENPEMPDVLGTFETKEHKYFVKLGNGDLKKSLIPFDGKEVTLIGWSSNNFKYFVVTGTVSSSGGAPTPTHRKRGGL